jgi:uncharacterized protein
MANKLAFDFSKGPTPDVEDRETMGFWEGTRQGEIRFPRCQKCHRFIWYPTVLCPNCHSSDIKWTALTSQPRLFTWSQVRWNLAPAYLPEFYSSRGYYIVALVEFDEAPSARLPTNIIDAQPEELRIGMPLEVAFQKVNDKITIPLFRPKKNAK